MVSKGLRRGQRGRGLLAYWLWIVGLTDNRLNFLSVQVSGQPGDRRISSVRDLCLRDPPRLGLR